MTRRNPWRVVREVAASVGVVGLMLLVVGAAVAFIVSLALEDVHLLWQLPAVLLAFVGAGLLIEQICKAIARAWRRAENRWEREARE